MAKSKNTANAKEKKAKNVKVSGKTAEYWEMVSELLEISKKYISRKKLRTNLLDPSTAFKVQHVLDNYYGGKMSNLCDAIKTDEMEFYAKVEKFNIFCIAEEVPIIRNANALLNLLTNIDRRRFYRKSAEDCKNLDMIIPLRVVERNYRGRK